MSQVVPENKHKHTTKSNVGLFLLSLKTETISKPRLSQPCEFSDNVLSDKDNTQPPHSRRVLSCHSSDRTLPEARRVSFPHHTRTHGTLVQPRPVLVVLPLVAPLCVWQPHCRSDALIFCNFVIVDCLLIFNINSASA